jgi:hypothetical protein
VLAEPASTRKLATGSMSGVQSSRTVVPIIVERKFPGAAETIPMPASGTGAKEGPQSTAGVPNDQPLV